MALEKGQKAPDFTLPDKNGTPFTLSNFDSKFIVIYFYPKDDTPGCTIESKGFNDLYDEFSSLGATIIGISGQDAASKKKFCDKYGLQFKLLADENFAVCEKYESYGEKKFMGRTFNGVFRKTFVLDKEKNILKIYDKVKPLIHPKEVFDFITQQ